MAEPARVIHLCSRNAQAKGCKTPAPSTVAAVNSDAQAQLTASASFVEFDTVTKTYDGESLAIADVSLAIRKSEFMTFLGPSGSGKTTALMMLAGFEIPSSGDIRLRGNSLSRVPPHRRNMGVVFQSYALFPRMTVAQNIAFPLIARRTPATEVRRRVGRSLELVQLANLDERRPDQLSGGQQQRVALARALVFNPDIVLMDEPLSALDRHMREQLQTEIKQIQEQLGITVVYVTHDQSEALTMSDRIAIFKAGSLQQVGTPQDVYERPANEFVAAFVGESNRLQGSIIAIHDDRWIVSTESGAIVQTLAVGSGTIQQRATLSIRPERIALGPAATACANCFDARLEKVTYHGERIRLQARLAGGGVIFANSPPTFGDAGVSTGATIKVGWRAEDCRAFPSP